MNPRVTPWILLQSLPVKVEKHKALTVTRLFPHGLTQEDVTTNSAWGKVIHPRKLEIFLATSLNQIAPRHGSPRACCS